MKKRHSYRLTVRWTGNRGEGTSGYTRYGREHVIDADGKPEITGSSDPAFRGDPSRYSPEDLLVASVSACHMLWYLHLCSDAGIVVVEGILADQAERDMGPDLWREPQPPSTDQ